MHPKEILRSKLLNNKTIAIIGAGASGTLLSTQLLNQVDTPIHLTLFDKNPSLGQGIAYAQTEPAHDLDSIHLLNVPVEKMTGDTRQPDGFYRWLLEEYLERSVQPGAFVPRWWFGDYLHHLFQEALSQKHPQAKHLQAKHPQATFQHLIETVIDLDWDNEKKQWVIHTLNEKESWASKHFFDVVVLALGNAPDSLPSEKEKALISQPRFIQNPWERGRFNAIQPHDHVFILGTGLTMIDQVLSLEQKGFQGHITALSRRGHLPHVHSETSLTPIPQQLDVLKHLSPKGLTGFLREQIAQDSIDWRQVADGLRPHTQSLWQHWTIHQKKQFLRHLSSLWEIHRHRMPPSSRETLNLLQKEKRLTLVAGRPLAYLHLAPKSEMSGSKIEIHFQPRGKNTVDTLAADWVINCAGAGNQLLKRSDQLIQNVIQQQKIALDDLQFGFKANANLQLTYLPQPELTSLYGLGPLLKGTFWECTAITEIRQQADQLARSISSQLKVE
jgi:uncharacterized NAD(P)/FAD-binding protein YdhS